MKAAMICKKHRKKHFKIYACSRDGAGNLSRLCVRISCYLFKITKKSSFIAACKLQRYTMMIIRPLWESGVALWAEPRGQRAAWKVQVSPKTRQKEDVTELQSGAVHESCIFILFYFVQIKNETHQDKKRRLPAFLSACCKLYPITRKCLQSLLLSFFFFCHLMPLKFHIRHFTAAVCLGL